MDKNAIRKVETELWDAADSLRAESKLTSAQYCMPVLGLIFLRYAYGRFKMVKAQIEKEHPSRPDRPYVITEKHFAVMKDNAILCNAGHFDVEVDMKRLREISTDIHEMRSNIMGYTLPNGRHTYVLAEGRLVNLAAGDGHPAEIMDMSFAIQALSAKYLVEHDGALTEKLISVPREVDLEVANRKLSFLGITIDSLTPEQVAYLNQG